MEQESGHPTRQPTIFVPRPIQSAVQQNSPNLKGQHTMMDNLRRTVEQGGQHTMMDNLRRTVERERERERESYGSSKPLDFRQPPALPRDGLGKTMSVSSKIFDHSDEDGGTNILYSLRPPNSKPLLRDNEDISHNQWTPLDEWKKMHKVESTL